MKNVSLITFILILCSSLTIANNIQVGTVTIANADANSCDIMFDLSWENSWRLSSAPGNHDAAWVFAKYRVLGDTTWNHATLTMTAMPPPTGTTLIVTNDGMGAFISRDSVGTGNVNFQNIRLRWMYNNDGVSSADSVEVHVHAIEMVYIPQGSFYVGDGESTPSEIYGNFQDSTAAAPFYITSEDSLCLGGGNGCLGNNNLQGHFEFSNCQGTGCLNGSGDDFNWTTSQTLPTAFPKGYDAFYMMKYEATQQQYVDMLNKCTPQQVAMLVDSAHFFPSMTQARTLRYGIEHNGTEWVTTEPYTPCIYHDWIRSASYADWAGLRPMTELEFEKACRGTGMPVVKEYPWGDSTIDVSANLTLANTGQANESITAGYDTSGTNGNCWINDFVNHNMNTVARVGIFAAHPSNSGRVSSGATYYGVMEMGGNAWDRAVSVGHTEGRKFDGSHGDGYLDADGYADIATWPGSFSSGRVDTNVGVGYRGGGLAWPTTETIRNARISSRRLASGYWNTVIEDDGFRLVRTAP